MVVYVLLKGYAFEGFSSDVEVFDSREKAEAKKQQYLDDEVPSGNDPDITFGYEYDLLKIVKRVIG